MAIGDVGVEGTEYSLTSFDIIEIRVFDPVVELFVVDVVVAHYCANRGKRLSPPSRVTFGGHPRTELRMLGLTYQPVGGPNEPCDTNENRIVIHAIEIMAVTTSADDTGVTSQPFRLRPRISTPLYGSHSSMRDRREYTPTIPGYTLVGRRPFAKGGNADVWKALDDSGRPVAIKILRIGGARPDSYARFQREVREHARLTGEGFRGVLPLLDHYLPAELNHEDLPWIVTPLAKRLDKAFGERPTLESVVKAVAAIADTLARLHKRSIAHRDVKPGNCYLYEDEWVLGDFGLIKTPLDAEEALTLGLKHSALGLLSHRRWCIMPIRRRGTRRRLLPRQDSLGAGHRALNPSNW